MGRAKYILGIAILFVLFTGTGHAQYLSCTDTSSSVNCTFSYPSCTSGGCGYDLSHAIACIGSSYAGPPYNLPCVHSIYMVYGEPDTAPPSTIDMCYTNAATVYDMFLGRYWNSVAGADTWEWFDIAGSAGINTWQEMAIGDPSWTGQHDFPSSFSFTSSNPSVMTLHNNVIYQTGGNAGLIDGMELQLIAVSPGTSTLTMTAGATTLPGGSASDSLVVTVVNTCAPAPATEEPMIFVTM